MRAVEVSTFFEDAVHLRLTEPVREVIGGPVKLIVLLPEPEDARDDKGLAWPPGPIDAAYGSCREDPLEEPPELPFESDRQPQARPTGSVRGFRANSPSYLST